MNQIKIVRATVVRRIGAVNPGQVLQVGVEISPKDAILLVQLKKAVEVGPKSAESKSTKRETTEAPPAGESGEAGAEVEEMNPLIAKALELTGAQSPEDLGAMSDEELLEVKGIGPAMLKGIRKALED